MISLRPVINCPSLSSYYYKNGKHSSLIPCRASTTTVAIASKKKTNNLYTLLSLDSEKDVGFDEIKKAYRSKALRYHPDVCPSSRKEESTKAFVELHEAYVTLSDPSSRRAYDMGLHVDGVPVRPVACSKETWETQLHELFRRSECRERARSGRDN